MSRKDIFGRVSLTAIISVLLLCAIFFRVGYTCLKSHTGPKQRPNAILEDISKATQESDDHQGIDAVPARPLVVAIGTSHYHLPPCVATGSDAIIVSRLSARAPPLSIVLPS